MSVCECVCGSVCECSSACACVCVSVCKHKCGSMPRCNAYVLCTYPLSLLSVCSFRACTTFPKKEKGMKKRDELTVRDCIN